jgi:hypothetical protein
VLFTTGYGVDTIGEEVLSIDGVLMLMKPYDSYGLLRKVRQILDGAERKR